MEKPYNTAVIKGRLICGTTFEWCLNFLTKRGKERYGDTFFIREVDYPVVYKLLVYFTGDAENAALDDIDLTRGIFLNGPIGCGKTVLMELMRLVPVPERNFIMRSCRDVSFEFNQEGFEVISRFSRLSYNNGRPKIYCFDDLGAERSLKYFGNSCNIMAEILSSRYTLFKHDNMITHVTTMLSPSEIGEMYGEGVRSRMREMFNVVSFCNDTEDKRK